MARTTRVKHEDAPKTYQHRAEPGVTQAAANEIVPLQFNGVGIHERGEMLSLTDMWKAAGSPENQSPAQWLRSPRAEGFAEAVAVNVGKSHNEIVRTVRGGRAPGTWVHWQLAISYARYLSHEFHIWTNTVARERMESRSDPAFAPAMVLAKLESMEDRLDRIDGMGRMTVHKVTGIQKEVALTPRLDQTVALLVERKFAEMQMAIVPDLTAGEVIEMAGLTDMKGLRRLSRWVSDRLRIVHAEKGVAVRRAKLGRSRAYVFDERVCRDWLLDGGKEAILMRAQEMRGQHVLRLVVPKKAREQ